MGSTHVVVGHLFAKGVTEPIYFFGWGFTWVFLGFGGVHRDERFNSYLLPSDGA
jgi:hypothetical protein